MRHSEFTANQELAANVSHAQRSIARRTQRQGVTVGDALVVLHTLAAAAPFVALVAAIVYLVR